MKIGNIRIKLADILTKTHGYVYYPPKGIKQTNRAACPRKLTNIDCYYWYAIPEGVGAILSSSYKMREIIEAYNSGKNIRIKDGEFVVIDD